MAAFVTRPWIVLSPRPPPLCSPPPVHLFRVDLNVVGVRTLVDLIGKGGPILLVPFGILNQSSSVPLVLFCDEFLFRF